MKTNENIAEELRIELQIDELLTKSIDSSRQFGREMSYSDYVGHRHKRRYFLAEMS